MSSAPPPRRHSAAVYRRRRLAALLLALLLVAAVVTLVVRPWSSGAAPDDAAQTASPSPSASAEPEPADEDAESDGDAEDDEEPGGATPAPDEVDAPNCGADEVSVTASAEPVAGGALLSLGVRNGGGEACQLNVGTSQQAFTVSDGERVVWRSTDCQTAPADAVVVLEPEQEVSSASPLEWDGSRSSLGTCDDEERPSAGAGTFFLETSVAGIRSSDPAEFTVG